MCWRGHWNYGEQTEIGVWLRVLKMHAIIVDVVVVMIYVNLIVSTLSSAEGLIGWPDVARQSIFGNESC
jgi:hypothetical protein